MIVHFARAARTPVAVFRLAVILGALLPVGCSSDMSPITWLHQDEGGEIAKDRPPIPLADAPYPNLATVPPRPEAPDVKARVNIAKGLVADRTNAQYTLATQPLPVVPQTAPVAPAAASSSDDAAGATLQAAAAPPRPVKVAVASPVAATASASDSIAAPKSKDSSGLSGAQKVLQPMREAHPADPVQSLPPLADAPPTVPNLAGLPTATAPTPAIPGPAGYVPPKPAAATKPAAPATPASDGSSPSGPPSQPTPTGLRLGFPTGSSTLPGNALAALKVFAHERGVRSMVVTGFGDVASSDAQAQAAGLSLALARARAVASYLIAVGVPPASLRVGAEAMGQGAAVRLVD